MLATRSAAASMSITVTDINLAAWTFMTYINWIIEHNMEAFSDIALL